MANSISTVAQKYVPILDEIVTQETLTSDLNMNQNLVGEFNGNGKIQIAKLSTDGLGDYSKTNGYPAGDINFSWEELALSHDRGRSFHIDRIDDEERIGVIAMNLFSTFAREKVIPEVDAVRFAKMADKAGTKVSKTFSGSTAVDDAVDAILEAEATMENNGYKLSDCIFYATSTFKNLLRKGSAYRFGTSEDPNTNFTTYDEMKLVTVPQGRFYSAIDLYDGTTSGEEDGGYTKASGGKDINFIIASPKAVAAIAKHAKLKYFDPDTNQSSDDHMFQYRIYHDMLAFDNKLTGLYVSKKA